MATIESSPTIDSVRSANSSQSASTGATAASLQNTAVSPVLHTLALAEHKAAAECLADAFADDTCCSYFFDCPDTQSWSADRKWQLHVSMLEILVYAHVKCGLARAVRSVTYTPAAPRFDAVALWMPPGANMDGWRTELRTGLWLQWLSLRRRLSREGGQRFFTEFVPLLHVTKTEVLAEKEASAWYLVYLGTRSDAQGKGLAKKLVAEGLERCNAEGRACYLESSNPVNIPIYRKMGFEVQKTIHLRRDQLPRQLDIMMRESVNQDGSSA